MKKARNPMPAQVANANLRSQIKSVSSMHMIGDFPGIAQAKRVARKVVDKVTTPALKRDGQGKLRKYLNVNGTRGMVSIPTGDTRRAEDDFPDFGLKYKRGK